MEPVKVHEGTEAGRRLDITLELLSEFEGIPLTYKQLAALLGPGATDGAIKKWPVRGIPLKWARKIAPRGVERGLIGLTIDWLVDGVGIDPYRRGPAKVAKPTSSGRGFDMKGAAARIAKSLEAALRKSELVISVGRPKELERQRALVWALKDLARQLKRMGYNMEDLFDLTDELAAEIGLPTHPKDAS